MRELQTREIQPEDYDLLLSLENRSNTVPLPKFLGVAFEKIANQEKGPRYQALQETP